MRRSGAIISRLLIWTLILTAGLAAPAARAQSAANEVYRVLIEQDIPLNQAQSYKLKIEGMGYVPVYLDIRGEVASVQYGNFTSRREAETAKKELSRNNITTKAVIATRRESQEGGTKYTLFAMACDKQGEAAALKAKLENEGYLAVKVRRQGAKYNVTVGEYGSENMANNQLVDIRAMGLSAAKAMKIAEAGTEVAAGVEPAPVAVAVADPKKAAGGGSTADILKDSIPGLSDKQLEQLSAMLEEKVKLSANKNPNDKAVSARIADLENKMRGVSDKVDVAIKAIDDQLAKAKADAERSVRAAQILQTADMKARAKDLVGAIAKAKEVLEFDPTNQTAALRISTWQNMIDNPNQDPEIGKTDNYNRLKALAIEAAKDVNEDNLRQAKTLWMQIKALDKQYEVEADGYLATIQGQINALPKAAPEGAPTWIYAAMGGVALLLLVGGALVYMKIQKNQREIAAKIQEATSLRPMRGIPGGRRASDWMLTGPSGGQTPPPGGPGAGAPMAPSGIPTPGVAPTGYGSGSDDLFGSDAEPMFAAAPQAAPSRQAGPQPVAAAAPAPFGSGGGFDDIMGSSFGSSPSHAPSAVASNGSEFDDLLSSLGGEGLGQSPSGSAPGSDFGGGDWALGDILSEAPVEKPAAPSNNGDHESISFDDIMGSIGGSSPAPQPAAASAMVGFDDLLGGSTNGSPAPPTGDRFSGSPFESLMGDPLAGLGAPPGADPLAGLGMMGDETIIEHTFPGGMNFPELGAGPGGAQVAAAAPAAASGGLVFRQDFASDAVGQRPASWTGEYAYAKLTVENATPAEGSSNYLAYDKREGAGKVYYATRFPNASGLVSVEFDMRCDDKNKFLLGFYIEKDEDFQQSIHTKILRSEAQTAPSIHIHGQPAPYMLGAWTHIKYVIDLNEGKVDGYVDGRHVARGITLTQVPKYLNTLAIRDNINTTGQLFITNVQVNKLG